MYHHKISLQDIDSMYPYELSILVNTIVADIEDRRQKMIARNQ